MKFLARINVFELSQTPSWEAYCQTDYPSSVKCFAVQTDGYDHWEVTADSESHATSIISAALEGFPSVFLVSLEVTF